ncbi:MAG: cell wall hydrolase [Lachnospiraceae bacterium]|nr:cell wall hydrolase [Lachnospiraceae bacterium]
MNAGRIRRSILTFTIIAAVSLSLPGLLSHASETTKSKLKEAQKQKANTEDQLDQVNKNIDAMEDQKDSLEDTLVDLNGQLSDVSDSIAELESNIASKETDIETTDQEIQKAAKALGEAEELRNTQYEDMKKQIRIQYACGNRMYMDLLLDSGNMNSALNRADYIEAFSGYQSRVLEDYKAAENSLREKKALLENLEKELEKQKEALDADKQEVQLQQDRITGLVSSTKGSIDRFSSAIDSAEAEALAYEAQIEKQNSDISRLKAQLAEEERLIALAKQSAWRNISEIQFAADDRTLLAALIYCESGNQPFEGQVAVGSVVMNRVRSAVYPNTVVGVIYQARQFSPVASGRLALALANGSASDTCYAAADAAMSGQTPVSDCLYFRTPTAGVTPRYTIGGHIFY